MFIRVPLTPPTAERSPLCPEKEAYCVWQNAAVKQPSVRSLPFKSKRFTAAVKKKKNPLRFQPFVRASPDCANMATVRSATVYEPSSSAAGVPTHLSGLAQVRRLN